MISAGELNKRIILQIAQLKQDSYGEPIETWTDIATVWANIITSGGREFYAAQKMNAETTAVIKMRYRAAMHTRFRIKYGNRYFEILSIADPEEHHESLLLSCKEVV